MNNPKEYLNNKELAKGVIEFQRAKRDKLRYCLLWDEYKSTTSRLKKRNKEPSYWGYEQEVYDGLEFNYRKTEDVLTTSFYMLSRGIIKRYKFNVDLEEVVQEMVLICFEKLDRFDPNYVGPSGKKTNSFSFFTTICLNQLFQIYRSANNYSKLKKKYSNFLGYYDDF